MKFILQIVFWLIPFSVAAQLQQDDWVREHLGAITWEQTFQGVLADYHPVTIQLATDNHQVVGYLIHHGDQQKHTLMGDWSGDDHFKLQERDVHDRLSGYLTGTMTSDQIKMQWMSADQSRIFEIKAFSGQLISIKRFKPVAEFINVSSDPLFYISVQKMDYGVISGMCFQNGTLYRFNGQCLDGTCSIWDAMMTQHDGKTIRLQMRQRDPSSYRVILEGREYKGMISHLTPLVSKLYDNSSGFLDFIYPEFQSKSFSTWIATRTDTMWNNGISRLKEEVSREAAERLVYRASGWLEIMDEGEDYVSGMLTFIHPGSVQRETFLWLKKEDVFIPQKEWFNDPADLDKASGKAMEGVAAMEDVMLAAWLRDAGFPNAIPSRSGLMMTTDFSMIYGDEFHSLPVTDSKAMIRKKYWKYFNW